MIWLKPCDLQKRPQHLLTLCSCPMIRRWGEPLSCVNCWALHLEISEPKLPNVGTHRWSHSLWISKWTLNWTQCPRIPHSSHLGAEFRFVLPLVRVTDPPAGQVVKTKEHSLFALFHSTPSTPSTLDLQGLLSTSPHGVACLQDPFFWAQQAVESCKLHWQQAQRTSPHCSDTRSCQSEDLRNTKQVSIELLSLQRKGATSFLLCWLSSNLAQQEQLVQPWSHNFLLQPPASSLQRLVTLNWA